MQEFMGRYRTMFLFRGLAAILFGILTLIWPGLSLSILVLMFGVFAIISGIGAIATALRHTKEAGWGLMLFEGIMGTLIGVLALVWPGATAVVFLFLLAAWAVITGILELAAPLSFPMSVGRGFLLALSGVLSIVFGILIASRPASGLLAVAWLIGAYAIVLGVMYVVIFFQARSLEASVA